MRTIVIRRAREQPRPATGSDWPAASTCEAEVLLLVSRQVGGGRLDQTSAANDTTIRIVDGRAGPEVGDPYSTNPPGIELAPSAPVSELFRVIDDVISSCADTPGLSLLTPREQAVFGLAAQGLTMGEIGEVLALSATTVKAHLTHGYRKLGVRNRPAAIAKLSELGLLASLLAMGPSEPDSAPG